MAALAGITAQFNEYTPVKLAMLEVNSTGPADGAHNTPFVMVITPGVSGTPLTVIVRGPLEPQLMLLATTVTVPVLNVPKLNCTELLVPPLVCVPTLLLQVNVAPDCAGQVKLTLVPPHNPLVLPVMDAGTVGVPTAMVLLFSGEFSPQLFW